MRNVYILVNILYLYKHVQYQFLGGNVVGLYIFVFIIYITKV